MAISTKVSSAAARGAWAHSLIEKWRAANPAIAGMWSDESSPATKEAKEPKWLKRREQNYSFYVGMDGAKGWAIHPRGFGYYLHRSKPWPATNFGPFDSLDAAKAAFAVMKDME